jgi:hypothetical protein
VRVARAGRAGVDYGPGPGSGAERRANAVGHLLEVGLHSGSTATWLFGGCLSSPAAAPWPTPPRTVRLAGASSSLSGRYGVVWLRCLLPADCLRTDALLCHRRAVLGRRRDVLGCGSAVLGCRDAVGSLAGRLPVPGATPRPLGALA